MPIPRNRYFFDVRLSLTALTFLTFLTAACASRPAAQQPAAPAPQAAPAPISRPLAGMAAERVLVFPARYLRTNDALGWTEAIGPTADFLKRVDDEIAFALRERGVTRRWFVAGDVARSAKRNASYVTDPYTLGEESLRPPRRTPDPVPDPLASDLRSLTALQEGARYVILPVEVRFEQVGSQGRAVLNFAVIDARANKVLMVREVASDPALVYSNAIPASLASRFADLIAPAQ